MKLVRKLARAQCGYLRTGFGDLDQRYGEDQQGQIKRWDRNQKVVIDEM